MTTKAYSHTIADSVAYMKAHYCNAISRDQLAARAGFSGDHYARLFRRHTGRTPMQYLVELRIIAAKQRLALSGDRCHVIAQQLGYNDVFYFSRQFKNLCGCSPSEYVSRIKQSRTIASLSPRITAHLLFLSMKPITPLLNPHCCPLQYNRDRGLQGEGLQGADLIFVETEDHRFITALERSFRRPVAVVNLPLYHHWRLRQKALASVLDRTMAHRDEPLRETE